MGLELLLLSSGELVIEPNERERTPGGHTPFRGPERWLLAADALRGELSAVLRWLGLFPSLFHGINPRLRLRGTVPRSIL